MQIKQKTNSKIVSIDRLIDLANKQPKLNFIWKGIKEQTLNFIVAPPKVGKTTLSENLGMSIAAGRQDFLGFPLGFDDNQRVMMISLEEYWLNRCSRNSRQMDFLDVHTHSGDWHENFKVANPEAPRYFQSADDWQWLVSEINEINPFLVIIDSLSRLYIGGNIEDSATSQDLTRKLRKVIDKTRTTLLVIHHTHKFKDEPISLANMAGSRILAQEADAVIGMNKTPFGNRYIKPLAYRYMDDHSDTVQLFTINEHGWITSGAEVNESRILRQLDNRTDDTNKDLILNHILEHTGGDISVIIEAAKLHASFVDTGKMSKPTMYSALGKLTEEGIIQKQSKGEYTLKQHG
jgi:KaiC/GvpD/RAD55 family RecA-like ATPase